MDNKEPSPKDQLATFIQHEVHHAVEDLISGPTVVRKLVGETIRHIGMSLSALSTSYLPLDLKEILVQPVVMADTRDALVLAYRPIPGDNTFQVMATAKKAGEELMLHVTLFRPNPDNLAQTSFFEFPNMVHEEILRQLQILIKAEGSQLFQAIMVKDYFDAAPSEEVATDVEVGSDVVEVPA